MTAAADPDRRLLLIVSLAAALYAVMHALMSVVLEPALLARWLGDALSFYCGGNLAGRLGEDGPYGGAALQACATGLGRDGAPPFVYPPWSLLPFGAVGLLEPGAAVALLFAAQTASLFAIGSCGVVWTRGLPLPLRLAFAALPAFSAITEVNLWLGQVNVVCAALVGLAALATGARRDWAAGALLASAAVIKPGFVLFLLLPLAIGRWRASAAAGGLFMAAVAASVAILGPQAWADYFRIGAGIMTPLGAPDWAFAGDLSLLGVLRRFLTDPWSSLVIAMAFWMAIGAVTIAGYALALALPLEVRAPLAFAAAAALTFLAGPFSWWAHAITLWLAAAALAPACRVWGAPWVPAVLAAPLLLPMPMNQAGPGLFGALPAALALTIWGVAMAFMLRDGAAAIRLRWFVPARVGPAPGLSPREN